jgi:hypothetical protein
MATLAFAGDARPWQRSLRWAPPAPDRRWIACGIALAVLLTAIEVRLFDIAMRREIVRAGHAPPDRVLRVELIEPERPLEMPPEPVPLPRLPVPADARRAPSRAASRKPPRRSSPEAIPSTLRPRLIGLDGHIFLPDELAEKTPGEPGTLAPSAAHDDAFARTNPLPYEPTRFDAYFPDVRESLGGEVIRKTTISHQWHTPWGTVIECRASLILLGIGVCTWGPAPRLTEEQLKAMRADPPLLPQPSPGDPPATPAPQPAQP